MHATQEEHVQAGAADLVKFREIEHHAVFLLH
jgi:hypothetical protein